MFPSQWQLVINSLACSLRTIPEFGPGSTISGRAVVMTDPRVRRVSSSIILMGRTHKIRDTIQLLYTLDQGY